MITDARFTDCHREVPSTELITNHFLDADIFGISGSSTRTFEHVFLLGEQWKNIGCLGGYTTQFILNHYKDPYLNNHYNGEDPRIFFRGSGGGLTCFENFQPRWDATWFTSWMPICFSIGWGMVPTQHQHVEFLLGGSSHDCKICKWLVTMLTFSSPNCGCGTPFQMI